MSESTLESRITSTLATAFPGLDPTEIHHQHRFSLRLGHKVVEIDGYANDKLTGRLDILLARHGRPLAVLELKRPGTDLTDSDRAQGLSYARLLDPMAPLLIVTNGTTTQLYRTIDGSKWPNDAEAGVEATGPNDQALDALFTSAARIAATQLQSAIETLLGTDFTVIRKVLNAISASTLADLTGDWGDRHRPFAKNLLFPRKMTTWITGEIARNRQWIILTGSPLSGKSNVLRELYEQTQSAPDTAFLFVEGSSSRHGLFQLIADAFGRELRWSLTADQARQWLTSVAANATFELIIAVDDCDPDVMASELDSLASSGLGPHVRIVLTCDSGIAPLLTRSRNQRQETRLGRLAARAELQPLDDEEFEGASKVLRAARVGFVHGAHLSEEYRAPWVLRTIAAGVAASPRYRNPDEVCANPSIPGPSLLDFAAKTFAHEDTLRAHYGAFADALLEELYTVDVTVNLARTLSYTCSRATLLKHISESELRIAELQGVFKSTVLDREHRAIVAQIPELAALMIALRLGRKLGSGRHSDPKEAAGELVDACERVPLGDVIGARAILEVSKTTEEIPIDVILPLLHIQPVVGVLAPGERLGRSTPDGHNPRLEVTVDGSILVMRQDDEFAPRELGIEGECQTVTHYLMPWMILSYVALELDDEEGAFSSWLLSSLATCDVVLLPYKSYAKCTVHKLQGFEEYVCHENGLVEPVTLALMNVICTHRKIGEQLADRAIECESAPMLARLRVAFRAILDLQNEQRQQWALKMLQDRIEPEFERLTGDVH